MLSLLYTLLVLARPFRNPLDVRRCRSSSNQIRAYQAEGTAMRRWDLLWTGHTVPRQYASITEPLYIVASSAALASDLWTCQITANFADRADPLQDQRGVPCHRFFPADSQPYRTAAHLCDAVTQSYSPCRPCAGSRVDLALDSSAQGNASVNGLVSFSGMARLARHCTHGTLLLRRPAKRRGSIYRCLPAELEPIELELAASNRTVTGHWVGGGKCCCCRVRMHRARPLS